MRSENLNCRLTCVSERFRLLGFVWAKNKIIQAATTTVSCFTFFSVAKLSMNVMQTCWKLAACLADLVCFKEIRVFIQGKQLFACHYKCWEEDIKCRRKSANVAKQINSLILQRSQIESSNLTDCWQHLIIQYNLGILPFITDYRWLFNHSFYFSYL